MLNLGATEDLDEQAQHAAPELLAAADGRVVTLDAVDPERHVPEPGGHRRTLRALLQHALETRGGRADSARGAARRAGPRRMRAPPHLAAERMRRAVRQGQQQRVGGNLVEGCAHGAGAARAGARARWNGPGQ
jgi:hypothetical protein